MSNNKQLKEAKAILKNVRVSPIKLNLVASSIRGLSCQDALNELRFSKKAIALDVMKTLMSAIANAQNNHNMDVDKLYVASSYVGKAVVMKRFHARAKGRGVRILKPFSHLFISVSEQGEV
jgi:large subunit ribosomal protein L22